MLYNKVLHAGLPKTGSTAFQNVMQNNSDILREHGVWYPPLKMLRERLTYPHIYRNEPGFDVEPFTGHTNIIISEEDILGKYFVFEEGSLFPYAQRNIERFASLLSWDKFDVWIVLRDYGDWLVSCYLQWVKGRRVISFEEYYKKLDLSSLSWPNLLSRIANVECVSNIHVILYEDFKFNNNLMYWMVEREFGLPNLVKENRGPLNESISEVGYNIIKTLDGVDYETNKKVRKFVLKELTGQELGKPRILSKLERRLLSYKYKNDINLIAGEQGGLSNVHLISIDSIDKDGAGA